MPTQLTPSSPIEVFISYAHQDEELRKQLTKHLSSLEYQGLITLWNDQRVAPGDYWPDQIQRHLNTASIILLLISKDFFASKHCRAELEGAMKRSESGSARVIPIIARECHWRNTVIGNFQALPTGGKAIVEWDNSDAAFVNIAEGIEQAVTSMAMPSIQITWVPSRGAGPDKLETISGTVRHVSVRDTKVVLFARTNTWYVQPYVDSSDTLINDDNTWENDTHLGFEYAALLVNVSYQPPPTTAKLPDIGGLVLAIATASARQ